MYGMDPRLPIDNIAGVAVETPQKSGNELASGIKELHKLVRENIISAQQKQKEQFDKHHRPAGAELDVGKWVWKKDTSKPEPGTSPKLRLAYTGPFRIVEKSSTLNRIIVHVSDKENKKIHAHIGQLKPYVGDINRPDLEEEEFIIEEILQEKTEGSNKHYLVRWAGYTKSFD